MSVIHFRNNESALRHALKLTDDLICSLKKEKSAMSDPAKLSYQAQLDADVKFLTDELGLSRDAAYSRCLGGKLVLTEFEKNERDVRTLMRVDGITRDEAASRLLGSRQMIHQAVFLIHGDKSRRHAPSFIELSARRRAQIETVPARATSPRGRAVLGT